jgi:hypothetical protein
VTSELRANGESAPRPLNPGDPTPLPQRPVDCNCDYGTRDRRGRRVTAHMVGCPCAPSWGRPAVNTDASEENAA